VYIEAIRILQSNLAQITQDLTNVMLDGVRVKEEFEQNPGFGTDTTDAQQLRNAEFYITPKEGRGLKIIGSGLNKPMIKVTCGSRSEKTEPAQNPVDPVWGDHFKFLPDITENFAEIVLLNKDGSDEKPVGYHNYDLRAIKDQKKKEHKIQLYDDDGREIGGDIVIEVLYVYNAEKTFKSDYENVMKDISNATKNYIEDLKVLWTPFQAVLFEGASKEEKVMYQGVMKDFSPKKNEQVQQEEHFFKQQHEELGEHFDRYSDMFKEHPSLIFLGIWIFVYTSAVVVASVERSMFFD
jgi:uncharacterized membrane-anchored protein YhcB (DUF1043 family)